MEITWSGLIVLGLILSVFIKFLWTNIIHYKMSREMKEEEVKVDPTAKEPVMVQIPIEDAIAIQHYIQKYPLEDVINLFMPLAQAIGMALPEDK